MKFFTKLAFILRPHLPHCQGRRFISYIIGCRLFSGLPFKKKDLPSGITPKQPASGDSIKACTRFMGDTLCPAGIAGPLLTGPGWRGGEPAFARNVKKNHPDEWKW